MRVIYDLETYENCFTFCCFVGGFWVQYEISDFRDDGDDIYTFLLLLHKFQAEMVGFNNVGFDYNLIHLLFKTFGKASARQLYDEAQRIITAQDEDKFANIVFPSDRHLKQIDLFKIHHFDNFARSTSLKVLEFNMRMKSIQDLPFPVGTVLTRDQIKELHIYNRHDVEATLEFYEKSLEQIEFRAALSAKHGRDFYNHSDVKIGKEIFQMALEAAGVACYTYGPNGREPAQTLRPTIALGECIPKWVRFDNSEFDRILKHLRGTVITETKGVFTDLVAKAYGREFVFGTGGLHASVDNQSFIADDDWMILDIDVVSYYPNLSITNKYYPQHLTEQFCTIYKDLYEQRQRHKKGTAENAMLKLALNGVYGASNDVYSVFYDPKFTMSITLTGQMLMAMLVEKLEQIPDVDVIQVNTDGATIHMPRKFLDNVNAVCKWWETTTRLQLEQVEYSKMFVRDVNNYIAQSVDGKIKRKGAYEYDLEWHQNHSAVVVAKVAEKALLENANIMETLQAWPDKMDFMLRTKVPRSSRLEFGLNGTAYALQNVTRYYVCRDGGTLTKVMPPLAKKPGVWRRIGIESGWKVWPCNDLGKQGPPIDYTYYANEIEKLTLGIK